MPRHLCVNLMQSFERMGVGVDGEAERTMGGVQTPFCCALNLLLNSDSAAKECWLADAGSHGGGSRGSQLASMSCSSATSGAGSFEKAKDCRWSCGNQGKSQETQARVRTTEQGRAGEAGAASGAHVAKVAWWAAEA